MSSYTINMKQIKAEWSEFVNHANNNNFDMKNKKDWQKMAYYDNYVDIIELISYHLKEYLAVCRRDDKAEAVVENAIRSNLLPAIEAMSQKYGKGNLRWFENPVTQEKFIVDADYRFRVFTTARGVDKYPQDYIAKEVLKLPQTDKTLLEVSENMYKICKAVEPLITANEPAEYFYGILRSKQFGYNRYRELPEFCQELAESINFKSSHVFSEYSPFELFFSGYGEANQLTVDLIISDEFKQGNLAYMQACERFLKNNINPNTKFLGNELFMGKEKVENVQLFMKFIREKTTAPFRCLEMYIAYKIDKDKAFSPYLSIHPYPHEALMLGKAFDEQGYEYALKQEDKAHQTSYLGFGYMPEYEEEYLESKAKFDDYVAKVDSGEIVPVPYGMSFRRDILDISLVAGSPDDVIEDETEEKRLDRIKQYNEEMIL